MEKVFDESILIEAEEALENFVSDHSDLENYEFIDAKLCSEGTVSRAFLFKYTVNKLFLYKFLDKRLDDILFIDAAGARYTFNDERKIKNELKSYEIAINCLVDVEDRSTFEVWVKMATRDDLSKGIEYCVSKGILKRKEIFNLIWEILDKSYFQWEKVK